jgi:hypothetical protein
MAICGGKATAAIGAPRKSLNLESALAARDCCMFAGCDDLTAHASDDFSHPATYFADNADVPSLEVFASAVDASFRHSASDKEEGRGGRRLSGLRFRFVGFGAVIMRHASHTAMASGVDAFSFGTYAMRTMHGVPVEPFADPQAIAAQPGPLRTH